MNEQRGELPGLGDSLDSRSDPALSARGHQEGVEGGSEFQSDRAENASCNACVYAEENVCSDDVD
jgi:hypothetical protein